MINSETIISDVQNDFEGGTSLSLNWDSLLERAMRTVTREALPSSLKRTVPIYGGISQGVSRYHAPKDIYVPSLLFRSGTEEEFEYMPIKQFRKTNDPKVFSIEYNNGVRFLTIKGGEDFNAYIIDEMTEVGTKTGGDPKVNEQNRYGIRSGIEITIDDTGVALKDTKDIDLSGYERGSLIVPVYIPDIGKLDKLEFRLKTDDSNYYELSSENDSIGDHLTSGWNSVKFELSGATKVGNPTDIHSWEFIGTAKSGETMKLILSTITLNSYPQYFLEYYSNAPFVDGVTGEMWKERVSYLNHDKINIDDNVQNILHYEMCLLVTQSSTFDRIDSQATQRFAEQLKRAYEEYWETFPSSEEPLSYNLLPEDTELLW